MKDYYIIGVDIGGTNTDAVLIDQNDKIIKSVKTITTDDISVGFSIILKKLLDQSSIKPGQIKGVFIGTTHATNAILQNKDLFRVGVIRIAGQQPDALPVAFAWPKELKDSIIAGCETINGGFECHTGTLTTFCSKEASEAIKKLLAKKVDGIAVVGVFSPLNGEQEKQTAALIKKLAGDFFPVSLSYEIGGIGFIERENSTILNTALKKVMQKGFLSLQKVCKKLNLSCPLMITQNDGSLMELERAIEYPVLTISSGPTNSFIGGARLSKLKNAIVVDIGGTSTDVGLILNEFPIRSLNRSNIGGISLNFPMPDVLSIGLGGGSIINFDLLKPKIGPQSIGKFLTKQALSFGGTQLTLTDIALFMKYVKIEKSDTKKISISTHQGNVVFDQVKNQIEELITKMQGEYKNLPVIFVGGGSALLPSSFFKKEYIIPNYFDVANAYGAALAEISGTIDTVVSLINREKALNEIYEKAKQKAIIQGANPSTLKLIDQQIIPYSYIPNQIARVIVRYSGKKYFFN